MYTYDVYARVSAWFIISYVTCYLEVSFIYLNVYWAHTMCPGTILATEENSAVKNNNKNRKWYYPLNDQRQVEKKKNEII